MTRPPKFIPIRRGDKPIGSVTTYLRKYQRGIKEGNVDVPCGRCNACCRAPSIFVDLYDDELKDFPEAVPAPKHSKHQMMLPKKQDGSCVHLIDGKCSIYARRPRGCRTYDCRLRLLLGLGPGGGDAGPDSIMKQALEQWKGFEHKTKEDRVLDVAIRLSIVDGGFPETEQQMILKVANTHRYFAKAERILDHFDNFSPEQKQQIIAELDTKMEQQLYQGERDK